MSLERRIETLFDGTNLTFSQLEVGCEGAAGAKTYSEPVLTNAGVDAVLGVTCGVDFPDGSTRNGT